MTKSLEKRELGLDRVFPWEANGGFWKDFKPANEAQELAFKSLSQWALDEANPSQYAKGFSSGQAMLIGPPGVGKSYLARTFFERVRSIPSPEDFWPALWVNAPVLMKWLPNAGQYWDYQSSVGASGNFEDLTPFAKMACASWLFLDDLREPRNAAERDFIVDLFDARSEDDYIVEGGCITTNLDAASIKNLYGERTFDRINRGALWLPMQGKSLRRPQSNEFSKALLDLQIEK